MGDQGEVTAKGTNDGTVVSQSFSKSADLAAGTYTLSCGGATASARCMVMVTGGGKTSYYSAPRTFTVGEGATFNAYIEVAKGATVDATLWPMLTPGDTAKPYSPYVRGVGSIVTS